MIRYKNTLLLLLLSSLCFQLWGQGCSDAGFCTMGAMKPSQDFSKLIPLKLRSVSVGLYEGKSNTSVMIRAALMDFGLTVGTGYNIQVKIPYMKIEGNFGSTNGLGDISLSLTKKILRTPNFDVLGTIGGKIPSNRSDLLVHSRDMVLPMYYQTSLGTYDVVAGASFLHKDWLISFGYQQPIIHLNENTFQVNENLWAWYDDGDLSYVNQYDEAVFLKRGADIMMRFERNFRVSRFNLNLGLLPIYRVSNDQGLNEAGKYEKLQGTTGLALSALLGMKFRFNVFSTLNFIYGHRITDRTYNPDGLTRKHVINLNYTYNF